MSVSIGRIEQMLPEFIQNSQYSKVFVLCDNNTKKHVLPLVKTFLSDSVIFTIKAGEEHKHIDTCQLIWAAMTQAELDRKALMINLGGGVIGDMGGFCAATYKRGIDFIQVPTTLLSQVDASVGGKLGIDFNGLKNHIGSFSLPKAVLIDAAFLKTLPATELRSGFAEVVKHCLIKDKLMWDNIKVKELEDLDLEELIKHSVEIKKQIVTADFKEQGERKILNFGHTIGHAVETYFLEIKKNKILHGQAVAAGMIMESYLAMEKGMIDHASFLQIEEYLFSTFGVLKIPAEAYNEIYKLTLQDKKNTANKIKASLLTEIGACTYDVKLSKTEILKALAYYGG